MPRNILALVRLLVLLLGLAIICIGAFCVSTDFTACNCNHLPIAYFLLPSGFILLVSGISWSTYHETSKHKGLFHSISRQNARLPDMHISTIDRPDFYPPSYEDSTDPEKQTFPLPICPQEQKDTYNIPPPLYTESSLECIEEVSSQEQQPPSYEVSVQRQAAEHDSASEGTSHAPVLQAGC